MRTERSARSCGHPLRMPPRRPSPWRPTPLAAIPPTPTLLAVMLLTAMVVLAVPRTGGSLAAQVGAAPGGLSFEEAYARLAGGLPHEAGVPRGRMERVRANRDGLEHRYVLVVPEDYDPTRRYPVAIYLHGGVSRPDRGPGGAWWRDYEVVAGHDRIAVFPHSWNDSYWWQSSQVENLRGILSELKRGYNVDENRVVVFGRSDGGTGAYFLAMRDPTPWAAFLPLIGYPGVLLNPSTGTDGRVHIANLANKPLFIVNAAQDRLYPAAFMDPFLRDIESAGGEVVFTVKPGGHDTSWWGEEAGAMERFIGDHPRDPHPKRILWATERTDRYQRAHWLVIDELGALPGDPERVRLAAFARNAGSGIVEAVREGNTVTLEARHVRRLTLLLSPEVFDLEAPVRVVANGETIFVGRVRPSIDTLRRWATLDEDRTMLYAAELSLTLPGTGR